MEEYNPKKENLEQTVQASAIQCKKEKLLLSYLYPTMDLRPCARMNKSLQSFLAM